MDPNSGRLYDSVAAAKADGVKDPVEIIGSPAAVHAVSMALQEQRHAQQQRSVAMRRAATKRARKARQRQRRAS